MPGRRRKCKPGAADEAFGRDNQWAGATWSIENATVRAGDVLEFSFAMSEIGSSLVTYATSGVNVSAFFDRRENAPDFPRWVRLHFAP